MIGHDARREVAEQIPRGGEFIETNKRNPSKHRIEEHDMLNWLKANRRQVNAGSMKPDKFGKFTILLEMMEQYKRVNQLLTEV